MNIEKEKEALHLCFMINKGTKGLKFWKHARKAFEEELGHNDFAMKKQYVQDGGNRFVCYYVFIEEEERIWDNE